MSWKLGVEGLETTLYKPTAFVIGEKKIEKVGRVASGKKVKDVQAVKQLFTLSYNKLEASYIASMLIEHGRKLPLNFIYEYNGTDNEVTVFFERFTRRKRLTPTELWGDITIVLEEE